VYHRVVESLFKQGEGLGGGGPRVVGVAVNANVWGTFDYLWPAALGEPKVGQRVVLPFGRGDRKTLGFVVDVDRAGRRHEGRLKAVAECLDAEPLMDEHLWQLGQWISRYYLSPLGETLAAMVPSAVGRHAPRTEAVVYLAAERRDWPERLGGRQKRLLDELFEARRQGVEPLRMEQLTAHSGASRDTLRRLAGRGLIRIETRPVVLDVADGQVAEEPFELNEEQKQALEGISKKLEGGFSVTLLHGVTGSGKTEVYVRVIRQVVAAGRQAIMLVPEIALATQTLQRLVQRLPRVAVLHSRLTSAQRAFYYQQIRDGHAAVVVGPRSAIFAPAAKLALIVVDEEHEPSFKQDTVPRYHGRDVAVMRGSLAGVPVVLGSATPSLESFHNAHQGRYDLLRLPHRVRGLPMPRLQIVSLRQEITPGRVELIGRTLTQRIAATLDQRRQVILLMNRRGFASFVFCPHCKWELKCDSCTRAMVFHQATQLVMCHYCQHTEAMPDTCPACKGKLLLFGLGIQRIEGELVRKFPQARLARVDSDTMTSQGQFEKVFNAFAAGELDILLGTQMVAKGLDFPGVCLVGVVSADTSLSIPDFRASERTFQLVVQVAGRAGRADATGEVVVQTLHPEEPAILLAAHHDYDTFAAGELEHRRSTNLPPFSRMVRFIVRHEQSLRAEEGAARLAAGLRPLLPAGQVQMEGPLPAEVRKIRNLYRFQVQLKSGQPGLIQQAVYPHLPALAHEPLQALVSGSDGLDDVRTIIAQAPAHLEPGAWLLLEHGYDQAPAVCALLGAAGFSEVQSRQDLAGITRCSGGRWELGMAP